MFCAWKCRLQKKLHTEKSARIMACQNAKLTVQLWIIEGHNIGGVICGTGMEEENIGEVI
jgi:hypothetical protein